MIHHGGFQELTEPQKRCKQTVEVTADIVEETFLILGIHHVLVWSHLLASGLEEQRDKLYEQCLFVMSFL